MNASLSDFEFKKRMPKKGKNPGQMLQNNEL